MAADEYAEEIVKANQGNVSRHHDTDIFAADIVVEVIMCRPGRQFLGWQKLIADIGNGQVDEFRRKPAIVYGCSLFDLLPRFFVRTQVGLEAIEYLNPFL